MTIGGFGGSVRISSSSNSENGLPAAGGHAPSRATRSLAAALIFTRVAALGFRPRFAFRIAARTCGGRGLPRRAAAIFARLPGSCAVAYIARMAFVFRLPMATRSRRSPSFILGTPCARRHLRTVSGPTPNQCCTAAFASRRTARAKSPYSTGELPRAVPNRPLNLPVAQPDDADSPAALILDPLADAATGRAVGAEVEPVAEHAGNGNSAAGQVLVAFLRRWRHDATMPKRLLNRADAIARFRLLIEELAPVRNMRYESPGFKLLSEKINTLVRKAFDAENANRKLEALGRITFWTDFGDGPSDTRLFQIGLDDVEAYLRSFIDEIENYWDLEDVSGELDCMASLIRLIERFHLVSRQLKAAIR